MIATEASDLELGPRVLLALEEENYPLLDEEEFPIWGPAGRAYRRRIIKRRSRAARLAAEEIQYVKDIEGEA